MKDKIILASRSGVRKNILNKNGINCEVIPADIDEENVTNSLVKEGAKPSHVSKNLAELKSVKISYKIPDQIEFVENIPKGHSGKFLRKKLGSN